MHNFQKNFKLNSGLIAKNRIVKSAMSENMGEGFFPLSHFENAYKTWSAGGAGILITGNVMVDQAHLGEPNNVVLSESTKDLSSFSRWAKAAKCNETLVYMQLNHPGKQSPKFLNKKPVAPSAIAFNPPLNKMFHTPKELTTTEIKDIIQKFIAAGEKAKLAGFSGVQIHGAHGYLVSQFLSPRHNQRNDEWGGVIQNRMRFLKEIITGLREIAGENFGIALKLNSADFLRGGFSKEDSLLVIEAIDHLGLDFIEISGGTYEATAMMGSGSKKTYQKESTEKREAYFVDFAKEVSKKVETPLLLTGGFRNLASIEHAIGNNIVDFVGMGRPFCVYPDIVKRLEKDSNFSFNIPEKKLGVKALDMLIPMEIVWYTEQIHRMGAKKTIKPNASVWGVAIKSILSLGLSSLKKVRA